MAKKYVQACGSELEFIRAALHGAEVSRVAHMMVSGHVCAYSIQPKAIPNPKRSVPDHANQH
jgi:DeoR family transcriptional regulator, suf operon transcriptional repressor